MKKLLIYAALSVGILTFAYTYWINIFTSRPCGQSAYRWEVLSGSKDKGASPFLTRGEVAVLPEAAKVQYEEAVRHASGLARELRLMLYLAFVLSILVVVLASQVLRLSRIKKTETNKTHGELYNAPPGRGPF